MEGYMKDVLVKAGVLVVKGDDADDNDDVRALWNHWIQMDDDDDIMNDIHSKTIEGMVPLSSDVYRAFSQLLQYAWQNQDQQDGSSALLSLNLNDVAAQTKTTTSSSLSLLASHVDAVRATLWLTHVMDFRVDDNDDDMSFGTRLLLNIRNDDNDVDTDIDNCNYDLINALFHHISTSLPLIQQDIYALAQTLRQQQHSTTRTDRSYTTTTSTELSSQDVLQSRLQHYQCIQLLTQRLLQELDQHLDRLQYIVRQWYALVDTTSTATAGNDSISICTRTHIRRLLAQVWHDYYSHGSGSCGRSHRTVGVGRGGNRRIVGVGTSSSMLENTSAVSIAMTLRILLCILQGSSSSSLTSTRAATSTATASASVDAVRKHLLFHSLVPLHGPSGLVLWRNQTTLLDLYHEPLVQCMATILQFHKEWIPHVVEALLQPQIWGGSGSSATTSGGGNTPKIVLLLHEVDLLLGLIKDSSSSSSNNNNGNNNSSNIMAVWQSYLDTTFWTLLQRLTQCMSSDNSRMAEQALQLFRNDVFCHLVYETYGKSVPLLLRTLVRRPNVVSDLPWNPTVRKMTHGVLQQLQQHSPSQFAIAAQRTFGGPQVVVAVAAATTESSSLSSSSGAERTTTTRASEASGLEHKPTKDTRGNNNTTGESTVSSRAATEATAPSQGSTSSSSSKPLNRFSLSAGMGSWRPPRKSAPARASFASTSSSSMGPPKARRPRDYDGQASQAAAAPPPLTVTGVAPWSTTTDTKSSLLPSHHKRNAGEAHLSDRGTTQTVLPPSAIAEEDETNTDDDEVLEPGLKRVLDYMKLLKPSSGDDQDGDGDGTSSWARAQMAETPTLLPHLKFHDLVFGHDLGKGAFGVVKYARRIDKTTTRSHWAEYAIKIISTAKIQEMGYEASVQREIATLRVLSHPCIARLVSSFRFGDGAYLVLEYASGGDLHSLLIKHGSLDEDSTRFVVGEIASALASIHDLGFVYADLKPENVLITETGHIKLTDFGGCRPLTEKAKELIRPSGKNLLKTLRDGDWKEKPKEKDNDGDEDMEEGEASDTQIEEEEEDVRIEGTTAYLPPEVVMGQRPTAAADSWALGCVLYQCLSGRPPLLEDDDHATRHKIVKFHIDEGNQYDDDSDPLFRDAHASDISSEARQLIRQLLSPKQERPSMAQVAEDPFFAGTDVFALHRHAAVPLDVGTVAPVEDATWSRRQFSSIWAPQPKAYDISIPQEPSHLVANPLLASRAPIPEGDEAGVFFSWRAIGA